MSESAQESWRYRCSGCEDLAHAVARHALRRGDPPAREAGLAQLEHQPRPYSSRHVLPPSSRLHGETKVLAPALTRNAGGSEPQYRVGGRMAPSRDIGGLKKDDYSTTTAASTWSPRRSTMRSSTPSRARRPRRTAASLAHGERLGETCSRRCADGAVASSLRNWNAAWLRLVRPGRLRVRPLASGALPPRAQSS